jgi:AraC-like DNA-binding protein
VNLNVTVANQHAAKTVLAILNRLPLIIKVELKDCQIVSDSHESDSRPHALEIPDPRLAMAAAILQSEFQDSTLSLAKLSERLGMSRSHLSRRFNAFFGMSFRQQLKQLRLEYAATLLTDRILRIKEVAAGSGYNHVSDMDHDFKKYYGLSPVSFRNRIVAAAQNTNKIPSIPKT